MPANCSGITLGKEGGGGIRSSKIDNYDGSDTPNIPATTGNTLNEVVEAIDSAIGLVTTPQSSDVDWDGALTIGCLTLTSPATVNTAITDLITQICTNKTDIATNTAAISGLCDSNIEICTEISTTCIAGSPPAIVIASGTTLDSALSYMLQLICDNRVEIGVGVVGVNEDAWDHFGSTTGGTDWIGTGGDIDISGGDLDPTIYNPGLTNSVYVIKGRSYKETSNTVTVVGTRDNYIKYDSSTEGYLVDDVPLGDPAPLLPTGQIFLWIATTNATLVTATVDLRHVYNQDGTRWSNNSTITRHVANLNITGDKLETYGTGTGTFDVGLGSIGVDDKGRVSSYSDSVNIAGLVNNQVLQYNSVASEWQNVDVSAVGGLPTGTLEGQTLRYNSSLTTWEETSTLRILGSSVSINSSPNPIKSIQLGYGSEISFELPLVSVNSLSSLASGTLLAATYFYIVTAIDINGDETYVSNEPSLTIDGVTEKSIQINWDFLSGAVSYRVYRGVATGAQTEYTEVPVGISIDDNGTLVYVTAPPPSSNTAFKVSLGNDGLGYNTTATSAKPFNFYEDWGNVETMITAYVGGTYTGTPTVTGIKSEINSNNPTGENIGLHVIATNSGGGGFRALRVEDGIDNTDKYLKVIDADGNVDFTTAITSFSLDTLWNGVSLESNTESINFTGGAVTNLVAGGSNDVTITFESIYGGSGSVPNGTIATIGDTLTFAGGDIDIQQNKLIFGSAGDYIQRLGGDFSVVSVDALLLSSGSTVTLMEGLSGSTFIMEAGEFRFSDASDFTIDASVSSTLFQFIGAGGSLFLGTFSSAVLTSAQQWTLPDATGTIALVGGAGSDGIYGGSGSVPTSVVATLTDTLEFNSGRVGMGGTPDANAILDLQSTTLGFLPPRMTTTQRNAVTPVEGLIIYDNVLHQFMGYNDSAWVILG